MRLEAPLILRDLVAALILVNVRKNLLAVVHVAVTGLQLIAALRGAVLVACLVVIAGVLTVFVLLHAIYTVVTGLLATGMNYSENGLDDALFVQQVGLALVGLLLHVVVVAGVGVKILSLWVEALGVWVHGTFFELVL